MKYVNESGRSMVEMLGVLAIIGVLSVGGIAGYSKAMNKYKINKTVDQLTTLVANIRTLFSSQTSYDGLTNAAAKKFGIIPNDMYTNASDSNLTNAYGGAVTIEVSDALNNGDKRAFVITYSNLSQEACTTILTSDWGSDKASGLMAIGSDLGEVKKIKTTTNDGVTDKVAIPGASTEALRTPIKITQAVNMCGSVTASNSVSWKYY